MATTTEALKKFENDLKESFNRGRIAKNETRHSHWLTNQDKKNVNNPEYQRGRALLSSDFIKGLRVINPNLILDKHPGQFAPKDTGFYKINYDKACLNLLLPDGKKALVCVCEDNYMPEWTTMEVTTTRIPLDADNPNGMWVEEKIPGRIEKRGWREVLLRCIKAKLITVTDAERVFGSGERESWAILTGKTQGVQ